MATVVQYPCSQFSYLTSGRTEAEAQELFEAWVAAHHPALLDQDPTMPRWETASYPPFNLQQDVVIVPPCCESFWNDDWETQTADCTLVRHAACREEIVQQIIAARNYPEHSFDEEFVADCYALAVARLLMAMMNRNLYYLQTPDEMRLKELMRSAIDAVRYNEPGARQQALQSAFDEISLSKDNYHPTQNYFIELTLVTQTTTGEALRRLLQESAQINLFMPSKVLEMLPETNPETLSQLTSAIEQNKIRFIVDDLNTDEGELPPLALLPILDVADHILAGISLYRELLNISPKVYGRLATGLTPALPQLLKLTEMNGAIHFAPLAGWKIKESEQSKIVWQGTDNTSTDALVRHPIDASTFLGFFEFADQFSSQINQDSVPTSVFALFPGQKSGWLDILRRMTYFTAGLGKFVDIEEYFSSTLYSGGMQRWGYEKYPVHVLTASEQNPISRWNELYRKGVDRLVQSSLETLLKSLNRPIGEKPLVEQFIEAVLPQSSSHLNPAHPVRTHPEEEERSKEDVGRIAVNPLSFARKIFVDNIAVDVPPLGYVYIEPPLPAEIPPKKNFLEQFFGEKSAPALARKAIDNIGRGEKRTVYILENRYFSVKIDALTGALRSIFTNRSRFNQLSRQIAFRNDQLYSIQAADEIIITQETPHMGQLKITGRLVCPNGETAARFIETVTIRSQSRLLEFDLTLEPLVEFGNDRWNSYIAVRHAWNDDTLEMRGYLNDGMHNLSDRKHWHSPKLIDLRNETESLTFLSEGLPFHYRSGDRQLDTLLIVKGESQRHFRLGVGINAKNPAFLSHDFLLRQEDFIIPVQQRPHNSSAWLFQIETQNVLALHWEALLEADQFTGYMVYLQELEGRRAHFALRSFLPPQHAWAMNFQGKEIKTLKVDTDAILIDMHAYELLPLMVRIREREDRR